MPRRPKKSKYKSVVIKKKRYYFYKITWLDITGDSGHADLHTAEGFMPSVMVTHAYLLNKDNKNVRTFASYEQKIIRTGKLDDMSKEEMETELKNILDEYSPILEGVSVEDVKKNIEKKRLPRVKKV